MQTIRRIMTDSVSSLIDRGAAQLRSAEVENPRSEAELLLAAALSLKRQDLWLQTERALDEEEITRWQNFIERRSAREPFAYIVGRKEFWSLEFKVNQEVLTPRPETELLIERLLDIAQKGPGRESVRVLDMGTGSGNIAVAVAREFPESKVVAVDVSPGAIATARENIRHHGFSDRIHLVQSDLFAGLEPGDAGKFDYIISNPPYIKSREIDRLMPEVSDHEPRSALDGGASGLEFYQRIVPESCRMLKRGGSLIMEIGSDQAGAVIQIIEKQGGYETPDVRPDYSQRDRVITAKRSARG